MPTGARDSGPGVESAASRFARRDFRPFLAAPSRVRRMRRRNGARRWALLHDAADPEIWIERYETPTWLDYLRMRERMTIIDRQVEAEVLACHRGETQPLTRYLLSHIPATTDGEDGADVRNQRDTVFDPTLPPGLATKRL